MQDHSPVRVVDLDLDPERGIRVDVADDQIRRSSYPDPHHLGSTQSWTIISGSALGGGAGDEDVPTPTVPELFFLEVVKSR